MLDFLVGTEATCGTELFARVDRIGSCFCGYPPVSYLSSSPLFSSYFFFVFLAM